MSDLISRSKAIRWIKAECNPYGQPTLDYESGIKVIEHLERMPSAQPEIQWTLCRDKEPAEELNCWFTANNCYGYRYVEKGMFTNRYGRQMEKGFITTFGHFVKWKFILAWMPIVMPEPWEGENDG